MSSVITQITLEEMMRSHEGVDRQALAELKQWNATQLHLPRLAEADLALFYLKNAYDMEAMKRNVAEYFVMRHHAPEFFASRRDLQGEIMKVFDTVFIVELLGRTKDSQKVVLARLLDTDPSRCEFTSAAKALNMVVDSGVWENGPGNEYLLIFDISGSTMEHRASFNWMTLKKFYDYFRRGSPLHYHENVEAMCNATGIERAMLPSEMGGEAGSAMELQKAQVKKLESHHAFLAGMENRVKLTDTQGVPTAVEVFGPEKDFQSGDGFALYYSCEC